MGWLMVGWLLLRLFKYQLTADGLLCRMCWYGYYIFQLALPVTLLYLAVILDHPEGEKKPLRPLWPPLEMCIRDRYKTFITFARQIGKSPIIIKRSTDIGTTDITPH